MRTMSLQTWMTALGLSVLAACGSVKGDDTAMPDAPAADTTPPQLMSSTPGDASKRASLLAPLTFVFNEDLAAGSVGEQSVQVTYSSSLYLTPVKGTVNYD